MLVMVHQNYQTIRNNVFNNNSHSGLYSTNSYMEIINNTAYNNGQYGLDVRSSYSQIAYNRLYSNVLGGLNVGSYCSIHDNLIENSSGYRDTIGLEGFWKFDEASGTAADDSSITGNDGTISGALRVDGRYGKGLKFDGIDDHCYVSDHASYTTTNTLFISAWTRLQGYTADSQYVISKSYYGGTNAQEYSLRVHPESKWINFNIYGVGTASYRYTGDIVDEWVHLAGHMYGTEMNLLVNGRIVDTTTVSNTITDTSSDICIGAYRHTDPSGAFKGIIDDVRVERGGIPHPDEYCLDQYPAGIMVQSRVGNTITDNVVKDGGGYAIALYGSADENLIHGNEFIDNHMGEVQAFDISRGVNFWNGSYHQGGNYWSDYTGTDRFCGINQDVLGSDLYGDVPYDIDGKDGVVSRFPLMEAPTASEASIHIITPQYGNTVSGDVIVTTESDAEDIERVVFYVDDVLQGSDPIPPYRFIWDSGSAAEDTYSTLKVVAERRFGGDISDTISVYVNNQVSEDDYFTLTVKEASYAPDQTASFQLDEVLSPGLYDSVELLFTMDGPSNEGYLVTHQFFPAYDDHALTFQIPSDASEGTYTAEVEMWGYLNGSRVWHDVDTDTFTVAGSNIRDLINANNAGLDGKLNTILNADMPGQIDDMEKTILDGIDYMNATIQGKIDDLIPRLDEIYSNIDEAQIAITSSLEAFWDDYNTTEAADLNQILGEIASMESSITDSMDSLQTYQEGKWEDTDAWRAAIEDVITTRMDQLNLLIDALNLSIKTHLDEIDMAVSTMHGEMLAGLTDVEKGIREATEIHTVSILEGLNWTRHLINTLSDENMGELRASLLELRGQMLDVNDSITTAHGENMEGQIATIDALIECLDATTENITSHHEQISEELDRLSALEDIITDIEEVSSDIAEAEKEIRNEGSSSRNFLIILLVLIVMLLIITVVNLILGRNKKEVKEEEEGWGDE